MASDHSKILERGTNETEQSKTVVIVTHDRNIAEQCDRIIDISDGRIVS